MQNWHHSTRFLTPVVQHLLQLLGQLRHGCRKIALLAEIVAQMVELDLAVFERFDVFVVAHPNGSGGPHCVDSESRSPRARVILGYQLRVP